MKLRKIEILEIDKNKKGDLFGRLIGDLFHSLGYDQPRLNIHKTGREIDLTAEHRTEKKIAIAECKAWETTVGGAEINKFVGVLEAEKITRKKKNDNNLVMGYFVSLSGFKETAIQQEEDMDNDRLILIKPEKLVDELVKGRIIVSVESAIAAVNSKGLTVANYMDLIVCEQGWVWVIYYLNSKNQAVSHFALVHAGGKLLLDSLASKILELDKKTNSILSGLSEIRSEIELEPTKLESETARNKYYKYLENELGDIQFEGLPTDKEAGSVKVKLENIFVPLHLSKARITTKIVRKGDPSREGVGSVLSRVSRLAILAKPGGGKSTLIKRIAMAYAFPSRRPEINDQLPDRHWFPIFLRCRELGDRVTLSITDIIMGIPSRAEIGDQADGFRLLIGRALQEGNALLLIDGLDEIADDKNRIVFVNQLRTFIATFPSINIIVTSREAGFRVVGGALASYCSHYKISNLNVTEIAELTLKWHRAIIDNSDNTEKESKKLSDLIRRDPRLIVLASNPLLLTTLLFVKRWAGYLPTKRNVLYQEMIKLLLVTWNVEGHDILEIEEAEPQLAYVAYWMTTKGKQTITDDELKLCLIEARKDMPEILGYTSISPAEFVKRVELRSSLLIMSGHSLTDSGNLVQVYEFLHLSFQEYLTAKAVVKKYLKHGDAEKSVVDLLKPYITNETWKEIIPMIAVLLERHSKDLIEHLVNRTMDSAKSRSTRRETKKDKQLAPTLLGQCLANEIQVTPEVLKKAMEWYAKTSYMNLDKSSTEIILGGKFGNLFKEHIKNVYFETYDDSHSADMGSLLGEIQISERRNSDPHVSMLDHALAKLQSGSVEDKGVVLFGLMLTSFRSVGLLGNQEVELDAEKYREAYTLAFELFNNELYTSQLYYPIFWSISWATDAKLFPEEMAQVFLNKALMIWLNRSSEPRLTRVIAWAISRLLEPQLNVDLIRSIPNLEKRVMNYFEKPGNEFDKIVAACIGSYLKLSFDSKEIETVFNSYRTRSGTRTTNILKFAPIWGIDLSQEEQENPEEDDNVE